ncbi:hypothetical protein SORBI_3003G190300 [Sorghum bicolor]|uniref:Uncharacterized protein n=1 Tax=Sorghum bicolor TaxID=4558 RepID=A0A1B6Q490_SORBI|nr:hypothetical protein SORBI_3003G190300 [Sorghum bicolor]
MAPPPRVTPSPDRDSTTRDIAASALCDALATCETLRHRDIASSRPRLHPPQSRSVTTEPTPPDAAASMITVAAPTQRSRIARQQMKLMWPMPASWTVPWAALNHGLTEYVCILLVNSFSN